MMAMYVLKNKLGGSNTPIELYFRWGELNTSPTYSNDDKYFAKTKCHKCDGVGILPHYMMIDNGVCYKCAGARFVYSRLYEKKHLDKLNRAVELRTQKKLKEIQLREERLSAYLLSDEYKKTKNYAYELEQLELSDIVRNSTYNFPEQQYGKKESVLVYQGYYSFRGYYGDTNVYIFYDDLGNQLKWFTSSTLDLEENDIIKATYTVKKISDYNNDPIETFYYINRLKIQISTKETN